MDLGLDGGGVEGSGTEWENLTLKPFFSVEFHTAVGVWWAEKYRETKTWSHMS